MAAVLDEWGTLPTPSIEIIAVLEGTAGLVELTEAVAKGLVVGRGLLGGRINEGRTVGKMLRLEDGRSVDGEVLDRYGMTSAAVDEVCK